MAETHLAGEVGKASLILRLDSLGHSFTLLSLRGPYLLHGLHQLVSVSHRSPTKMIVIRLHHMNNTDLGLRRQGKLGQKVQCGPRLRRAIVAHDDLPNGLGRRLHH